MRKVSVFVLLIFIIFFHFWTNPVIRTSGTLKIYDRNGILLFEQAGDIGRKQRVTFEQFPQHLRDAVIAAEDERFLTHPGVDLQAIMRSALLNVQERKIVSGASTISQQVARLVVEKNSGGNRYLRKVQEILIALRLSLLYSKNEILTLYLNEVYLGNHNYGFQAASRFYFNKNVEKLSVAESAYLAGIIASPARYDPYTNKEEGVKRQTYVLDRMVKNKFITNNRKSEILAQETGFNRPDVSIKAPHFVEYIRKKVEANLEIPSKTNLSVYTTLDYNVYKLNERIVKLRVKDLSVPHDVTNAATVFIDNNTGALISMVGGVDFFNPSIDGQVNSAVALRQPGSALKPITYASAFKKNYTPASILFDVRKTFQTKKGEGFIPNNYGDTFHGPVSAREALASSYNMPAVDVLHSIGMQPFFDLARTMGITTFKNPDRYDLSITLGGAEVTLLELSNLYATFARYGNFKPLYSIEKITDGSEKTICTKPCDPAASGTKRVLDARIAYLITDILADNKARMPGFGEKNYLTLSRPAAVKTGTTTDWHDVWTVGYTPSHTFGVWMGNNNNEPMRNISSATGAAPIWHQFMEEYYKGKPVIRFKKPAGMVEHEICTLSGQLYDGICPEKRWEQFVAGTEPKKRSEIHKKIAIDTRNGLRANLNCAKEFVQEKVFADYPEEVYTWALLQNKPIAPAEYSPLCGTVAAASVQEKIKPVIEIVTPKEKAVFQKAPDLIRNEGIVFEVNVSSDIKKVDWYLNGRLIGSSSRFPFSYTWQLRPGKFTVQAAGGNVKTIRSKEVTFEVIQN